jgi:hypothetical protein
MNILKNIIEFVHASRQRFPIKITMLFLSIDLLFILIDFVVRVIPSLETPFLRIKSAYGVPSFFQYGKELLISLLLIYIFFTFKRHVMLYLSWALLFFFLLIYDAGEIQEILGETQLLSSFLDNLGSVIDEFVPLFIISAVFGLIIIIFYRRSTDEISKQVSQLYFILLGMFAFFAVGVDAALSAIGINGEDNIGKMVRWVFITIEEGGEMFVLSLALGLTIGVLRTARQERDELEQPILT